MEPSTRYRKCEKQKFQKGRAFHRKFSNRKENSWHSRGSSDELK